jgi:hypothetical protein
MPDTPALRAHYGVPSGVREGLGFPMSHLLLLMDHRSGLLIDCVDSPMNTSDISQTPPLHAHLGAGDILLGDVLFSGWAHLALILREKLHAVMPVHQRRIVSFAPKREHAHPRRGKSTSRIGKPRSPVVKTLGVDDQLVEYPKPVEKPEWMDQQQWESLPEKITVREIRRTIKRHGFRPITMTIVTTLLDPELYPADELIDLRLTRWMIETNLRHLKHAARSQRVNVNRLSFADTLAWLRWGDITTLPKLKINPLRPGRLEPRVIKRQKKQFPYMTKTRAELKSELRARHCDTA